LKEKLADLRRLVETMDFTLANFDTTYNRFKALLGE